MLNINLSGDLAENTCEGVQSLSGTRKAEISEKLQDSVTPNRFTEESTLHINLMAPIPEMLLNCKRKSA